MEAGPTPPAPGGPRLPAVWPTPRRGAGPHHWQRLTRTRRGTAGLVVVSAALLLWPFAGWFWIPWLAGLVTVVLIALLRLDRLLHGWSWHVGGLVVLAGMMLRTGPWDWALAASLGVLVAGLLQLPWWRLAAVGAVLCLLAGAGWGIERHRAEQVQAAQEVQRSEENFGLLGERTPERVLPALLEGIGQSDVVGVCGLLATEARSTFVQAARAADCRGAVEHFHTALPQVPPLRNLDAPLSRTGGTARVDGCRTLWGSAGLGGSDLGVLDVAESEPPGRTFFVSGFRACPTA